MAIKGLKRKLPWKTPQLSMTVCPPDLLALEYPIMEPSATDSFNVFPPFLSSEFESRIDFV